MKCHKKSSQCVFCGISIGLVNGLLGGGGGMIAVPVLQNLMGYPEKQAHATAISIIAPVCAVGAVPYLLGGYFEPSVVIPTAIGSVIGGMLGAYLMQFLPTWLVSLLFILVMSLSGFGMLGVFG